MGKEWGTNYFDWRGYLERERKIFIKRDLESVKTKRVHHIESERDREGS